MSRSVSPYFGVSILAKTSEKYLGFNGIRTRDLRDTGAWEDITSTYWPRFPNVWLHSSVGRASHRHRAGIVEVTGSNPVEALIFFRLLPSKSLNWKIYCDDHSSLSSTTAAQYEFHIYFTYMVVFSAQKPEIQTRRIMIKFGLVSLNAPRHESKAACKRTGFVRCTSSQHVDCLLSAVFKWPQHVERSEDFTKVYAESWLRILGYAGHCACVDSKCWALLCKCTRLCWATHGWPRNKGNVERKVWPVSNLTQHLSTGCSNALNMLRAWTVDNSSAFARGLRKKNQQP